MVVAGVRVKFDKAGALARIKAAAEAGQELMASEALKDANYYVRKQTGELEGSGIRNSELKKGLLIWRTKYARKVYYTGEPRTNVNPNARKLWAHEARAKHGEKWRMILQKAIDVKV